MVTQTEGMDRTCKEKMESLMTPSPPHHLSAFQSRTQYATCYLNLLRSVAADALHSYVFTPATTLLCTSPSCTSACFSLYKVADASLSAVFTSPASALYTLFTTLNDALVSAFLLVLSLALPPSAAAELTPSGIHTSQYMAAQAAYASGDGGDIGLASFVSSLATLVGAGIHSSFLLTSIWMLLEYANLVWFASALLGAATRVVETYIAFTLQKGVSIARSGVADAFSLSSLFSLAFLVVAFPPALLAAHLAAFLALLIAPALALSVLGVVPGMIMAPLVLSYVVNPVQGVPLALALGSASLWLVARIITEGHLGTLRLFFVIYFDARHAHPDSALLHAAGTVAVRIFCTPIDRSALAFLASLAQWPSAILFLAQVENFHPTPSHSTPTKPVPAVQVHLPPPPSPPPSYRLHKRVPTPRGFSADVGPVGGEPDERVISFMEYHSDSDSENGDDVFHSFHSLDPILAEELPPREHSIVRTFSRSASVAASAVSSLIQAVDESRPTFRHVSPPRNPPTLRRSRRLSEKKPRKP